MNNSKSIPFWDEQKKFYKFFQDNNNFCIKKDDEIVFESSLLKLKTIEEYPVRPLIMQGKLFLFNYDRGVEMHKLDGSEKFFFDVRAVQLAVCAESFLLLKKNTDLVTIDVDRNEISDKIYVSESFYINVVGASNYLLFYRFKRNKTYLYDIKTKEFSELPKFNTKLEIITQIIKIGNKLIVYYAAAKELENPIGVYIYNLQDQKGSFYAALSDFSAVGHKYLDLLNFSFNDFQEEATTVIDYRANYIDYLRFILQKFGIFALLYYCDDKRLQALEESSVVKEIRKVLAYFKSKMERYPACNEDFNLLCEELRMSEDQLCRRF